MLVEAVGFWLQNLAEVDGVEREDSPTEFSAFTFFIFSKPLEKLKSGKGVSPVGEAPLSQIILYLRETIPQYNCPICDVILL